MITMTCDRCDASITTGSEQPYNGVVRLEFAFGKARYDLCEPCQHAVAQTVAAMITGGDRPTPTPGDTP